MNKQTDINLRHIAILAHGATGTSILFDHLLNNKYVFEKPNQIKEALKLKNDGENWYERHILPLMEEAEDANQKLVIHISPVKVKECGLTMTEVIQKLNEKFDLVHLVRQNALSKITSILGKKHKKVEKYVEKTKKELPGIDLTYNLPDAFQLPRKDWVKTFDKFIEEDKEIETACKVLDNYYFIDYEKEINKRGPYHTTIKLSAKLGFCDPYLYNPLRQNYNSAKNRWSDLPLKDKISNFGYISKLLAGTRHEWMLRE